MGSLRRDFGEKWNISFQSPASVQIHHNRIPGPPPPRGVVSTTLQFGRYGGEGFQVVGSLRAARAFPFLVGP